MLIHNPFAHKSGLKWLLSKLKEDDELDKIVRIYVESVLGHKIIMRPSKGPHGEQGKDIVAVENDNTKDYCSYIVKRGNLQRNLYGKFGILKQLNDALTIDLELQEYTQKKELL